MTEKSNAKPTSRTKVKAVRPGPSYEELAVAHKTMREISTTMEQASTACAMVSHDVRAACNDSDVLPKTYMEISVLAFLHGELLQMARVRLDALVDEVACWDSHFALDNELEVLLNGN